MSLARWHTGTKAQTLAFLREIGKRYDGMSDDMAAIEHDDRVHQWDVAILECRICATRQTAVLPVGGKGEDRECPRCGNMTADVVEIE